MRPADGEAGVAAPHGVRSLPRRRVSAARAASPWGAQGSGPGPGHLAFCPGALAVENFTFFRTLIWYIVKLSSIRPMIHDRAVA